MILNLSIKNKRGELEDNEQKPIMKSNRKKDYHEIWVVEHANFWHYRYRKLFTRYGKKSKNYLGLILFSYYIILSRKIILAEPLNRTNGFFDCEYYTLIFVPNLGN